VKKREGCPAPGSAQSLEVVWREDKVVIGGEIWNL